MQAGPKDDELSTFKMIEDAGRGGIRDSVIAGDVHHHHYPNQAAPQPQTVIIGNTEMNQTSFSPFGPGAIPIQGKSSLASIIGVCVFIAGVISLLASGYSLIAYSLPELALLKLTTILTIPLSLSLIFGGFEMTKYKRRGVQLALLTVILFGVLGVVEAQFTDEIIESQCEAGELTREDCDNLSEISGSGIVSTLSTVFTIICYGFCGLIVSIPMLMVNGGLDDSSLFKV
ncbi:MAG: hypothetical protein O3A74_08215 [archaeon]|nr:hypothetical protein [archaeon]MDA0842889.1 hypothetical protein [archaeon]